MFAAIQADAGGVNQWSHIRVPTPLDRQPIIRQNRDTQYSVVVVDMSEGATLTLPDGGARYVSAMPVNQDPYVNRVLHEPGEHRLTVDEYGTRYVLIGVRMLVYPNDSSDLAAVNALRDQLVLSTGAGEAFAPPDYDEASFAATRRALRELAKGVGRFDRAFGRREDVDPVRHLIATAAGWGGLREPNCLPIMDGWNYLVRLYRLRPEVLDWTWTFPATEPA